MEPLIISKTSTTPAVRLDPSTGSFQFEGRSIPEDAEGFYGPILSWLNIYFKVPAAVTRIEMKLDYVNSGSSKYLLEFFRVVGRNYRNGHDCMVIWFYEEEDEAIQELGDHYNTTVKIPFEFRITGR